MLLRWTHIHWSHSPGPHHAFGVWIDGAMCKLHGLLLVGSCVVKLLGLLLAGSTGQHMAGPNGLA
jgi:hypothetical protein